MSITPTQHPRLHVTHSREDDARPATGVPRRNCRRRRRRAAPDRSHHWPPSPQQVLAYGTTAGTVQRKQQVESQLETLQSPAVSCARASNGRCDDTRARHKLTAAEETTSAADGDRAPLAPHRPTRTSSATASVTRPRQVARYQGRRCEHGVVVHRNRERRRLHSAQQLAPPPRHASTPGGGGGGERPGATGHRHHDLGHRQ